MCVWVGGATTARTHAPDTQVCLVKPGRTPISIVVNEMSKRKTPALVGLVQEGGSEGVSRVLGEEAFSLAIRYPQVRVCMCVCLLLVCICVCVCACVWCARQAGRQQQ